MLSFADEQRGWAVGALGTILMTPDGGDSWQVQRAGGSRAAVLGLFSEAERIPLELFTEMCGNEGYLGVVELLTRRDIEAATPRDEIRTARAKMGVLATGGCYTHATWRFPLRQAGLPWPTSTITTGWSIANQTDGLQALEEHLVQRIRQWRPDIIVTEGGDAGSSPLSALIRQAVVSAADRAAGTEAYAKQLSVLGLQPWKVKRIVATSQAEGAAELVLDTARLATQLGCSVREHSAACRGFTHDAWSATPAKVTFNILVSDVPRGVAMRDFFDGALLPPGSAARRTLGTPPPVSLAGLNRAAQKQRELERLLTAGDEALLPLADRQVQLDDLTRDLAPSAASALLYQLAQHYRELGQYQEAAHTLSTLATKFPHHPLTDLALEWLVQYRSSAEVDAAFGTAAQASSDASHVVAAAAEFNAALPAGVDRRLEITQFDNTAPSLANFDTAATGESLAALATGLQQTRPMLFAEPRVRMALAAALRRHGDDLAAQRLYQQLAASQPPGAWKQAARSELWLDRRAGHPPKPTFFCVRSDEKPVLDGRLDDTIWQQATSAELHSPLDDDETWPATVWLARDDEFVYWAVECRKAPSVEYPANAGPRPRDPDLSAEDRMELLIDIDRDYATSLRFTVDHRGWTGEACWEDRSWNPTWYVAAATDVDTWRAEAAIPLDQLTRVPVAGDEVWGVGLQRIVPGWGFQSWSQPANVAGRAEGFGLLLFE